MRRFSSTYAGSPESTDTRCFLNQAYRWGPIETSGSAMSRLRQSNVFGVR